VIAAIDEVVNAKPLTLELQIGDHTVVINKDGSTAFGCNSFNKQQVETLLKYWDNNKDKKTKTLVDLTCDANVRTLLFDVVAAYLTSIGIKKLYDCYLDSNAGPTMRIYANPSGRPQPEYAFWSFSPNDDAFDLSTQMYAALEAIKTLSNQTPPLCLNGNNFKVVNGQLESQGVILKYTEMEGLKAKWKEFVESDES